MLQPFSRAVAQLFEAPFQRVLWGSLALTTAVFVLLAVGLNYALPENATEWGWVNWLIELGAIGAFVVVLFFLFPAIATLFIGLFLEAIAAAVERRHYAADAPGREVPFVRSLGITLRFALVLIVLNLLALPLYLFLPAINIVVFYGLNGYLLGREYFELVAHRHLGDSDVGALRRANRIRLLLTGVVIAFLLTVPLVNLVAPIIATAAMVHVFKRLRPSAGAA